MSSWLLIIFVIVSSLTLGDFPNRFLKCSFHRCIHSSWLAAFSLALAVLFLLLTSFTVSHAILDYLSSAESLILLICSWMYSGCSFRHEIVSSLCNCCRTSPRKSSNTVLRQLASLSWLKITTRAISSPSSVCRDLPINVNRSDYSLALEKLHPGTTGND